VSNLDDVKKEIGRHIIGNLDGNGYLKTSVEEISESTGHTQEQVIEALSFVQKFDPVGVAARDLKECLLIQVRFRNLEGTVIEEILLEHMDKLENKKYDQIAKSLSISIQEVKSAVSVITSFEPKPGRSYHDEETIYISPDIYVFRVGDDYVIDLNEDGLPKLRISQYYRQILARRDSLSERDRQYIQEKLKSAAWLIKSIHQRQRTIYRVT
jgi:RNA polymerase sigma-54 factor